MDKTLFWNMNIFLVLRLVLEVVLSYIFSYRLDYLANWTCRPQKMYCMHAFFCLLFLDEFIGRFIPSLYTYHYCLRFYGNLSFPHLRMAHDDTSLHLDILISQSILKLENSSYFIYNNCTKHRP